MGDSRIVVSLVVAAAAAVIILFYIANRSTNGDLRENLPTLLDQGSEKNITPVFTSCSELWEMQIRRNLVFVVGLGGSGSRGVASFLHDSGLFVGRVNSITYDTITNHTEMNRLYGKFLNLTQGHVDIGPELQQQMAEEVGSGIRSELEKSVFCRLRKELQQYESSSRAASTQATAVNCGPAPWKGFSVKNCRNGLILSVLHVLFPDTLRVVHLVRDGRNMALSKNRHQLRSFGDVVLGNDVAVDKRDQCLRQFAYWSKLMKEIRSYGERVLLPTKRYFLLHVEDFVTNASTQLDLLRFVGAPRSGSGEILASNGVLNPRQIRYIADFYDEEKEVAEHMTAAKWLESRESCIKTILADTESVKTLEFFGYKNSSSQQRKQN